MAVRHLPASSAHPPAPSCPPAPRVFGETFTETRGVSSCWQCPCVSVSVCAQVVPCPSSRPHGTGRLDLQGSSPASASME